LKTNQKISCAITAALSASAGTAFAASEYGAAGGLEEVVVTAQRRSESIQDVPITIQAITGDQLRQLNVSTFDDVLRYLPNVTFSPNGPGQGNIYMRGLSAGFAGNQSSASIAPFPNVATYLDEQSMTFPSRNLDVYMVDMERVEVLEGPQGTLFGGGAEAGAIRYITNKPKLSVIEGNTELSYGTTAHGDPNAAVSATINLPLIKDTLAVRGTIYNDKRGGYIDNVPSTFTRKASDPGPGGYSSVYPASVLGVAGANNFNLAKQAQNPLTFTGMRLSAAYKFNDDWDALIQQSYQNMEADGMSAQYPLSSDGVALGPWRETSFSPAYDKDRYSSTAWTLNGKFADLRALYTGSYLTRHINNTMDYTNYARSQGGFYYTCVGGPAAGSNFGAGTLPGTCYSPVSSWEDTVQSTHQSHEFRLSTPDEWRLRGLVGAYWEDFRIKDDMNFLYKSIPGCTPHNLAIALAGGPLCLAAVQPINAAIDPSVRNDNVAFGEDLERGYKQTAFFTSIDFDLIPKVLTATAGTRHFRYTEDEVGSQYKTTSSCINKPQGDCHVDAIDRHGTDSGFRSRAGLTWHVTPDAMLYYTFSQGFRPGAFNRVASGVTKIWVDPATGKAVPNNAALPPGAFRANQFFKPVGYPSDTLINNEIGLKSEFFDHRLLFDASAYKMKWENVQTQIYNPPVYGNTTFGIQGPDYEVKGFELQFIGRVTDGLSVQGSLSYNDAKQINSPCIVSPGVTPVTAGNPTPAGQCITQVRAGSVNVPVINPLGGVGDVPAFSPKLEFNLRLRYDWTVNDMKAFAMVGGNHVGEMSNEPSGFTSGDTEPVAKTTWLRYTMPSYNTYDASFGIGKDNWTAQLYGSNLGNSSASLFTSSAQFIRSEVPLRPRVLGVKLGLKF